MISTKPWYGKLLAVLGLIALLSFLGLAITGYLGDKQSKKQTQGLEIKVKSLAGALEDQTRTSEERNRALTDQIGDCNAMMQALRTKSHAPAHFKRGISEKVTTSDSIRTTRKR
jgi:uncharacterized protein HemX